MLVLPAIDLLDGHCVRLVQGRREHATVYSNAPADVALRWRDAGVQVLHVVDLSAAFDDETDHTDLIGRIARTSGLRVQVGGGVRTVARARILLESGVSRIIVGTRALEAPEFMNELIGVFGAGRVLAGVDAREGRVATHGWVHESEVRANDLGVRLRAQGARTAVYTDITRDGALTGPNLERTGAFAETTGLETIASGGIATLEDVRRVAAIGDAGVVGMIIGVALYEERFTFEAAQRAARETATLTAT
jgi:phosphoribosylformimino-5-aminoimidazole carboxamide ribotide isomerase